MSVSLPERRTQERLGVVPALYAIADGDALGAEAVPGAVARLATAGVRWIQIRLKNLDDRQRYEVIEASARRLDEAEVETPGPLLWIDDRADLATIFAGASPARRFGVHVGQHDLPPAAVRRVVGEGMPIGQSCHELDEVRRAEADPEVDVVAIGPVYGTTSKAGADPEVGLDGVRAARRATGKPLVAIGGLGPGRLGGVRAAGADSVVVLSALSRPDGPSVSKRVVEELIQEAALSESEASPANAQ